MSAADSNRSLAAALTPSGRGAVAVIGVRGPLATAALTRQFQSRTSQPLADAPLRRILYGTWQANADSLGPREDVVLTRLESHWELGCHGGAIAATAILHNLRASGIETVSWQDWLTLTAPNRLQASAAQALAAAQSPNAALALLRAAELTDRELRELCDSLDNLRSESSLRSSPGTQGSLTERRAMAQARIDELLSTARWAMHLIRPWNIVLAGLPNAGKSSLLNALVGYERAIVFEQPGTTRDVVTAAAAYDGWRWELRDTAGLRATDDSLETLGIARTTAMLATSDVIVLVIDGTRPWSESEPLRRTHPQAIIVCNKADLWEGEAPAEPLVARASSPWNDFPDLGQDAQATANSLTVSAINGQGLEELRAAIHQRLALPPWPEIGAIVWDAALAHDLHTVRRVLEHDPAALPAALGELWTWIAEPFSCTEPGT